MGLRTPPSHSPGPHVEKGIMFVPRLKRLNFINLLQLRTGLRAITHLRVGSFAGLEVGVLGLRVASAAS